MQLLLSLALCSVAYGRLSRGVLILKYESCDFGNLGNLHKAITTKSYSKEDLNQTWKLFEEKHGSYKKAQDKWFDFLQSKVEEQHGRFTRTFLTEGRMGSTFAITFRGGPRRARLHPQHRLCLKLPKSFKGTDIFDGKIVNVWEANVNEFDMAQDFKKDQENFPCTSITDHIDIQHAAGRGSYILLPLFAQDLRKARLSSDQAIPMMQDLLMACRNLHGQMRRVHGDLIKPNIMTTRDTGRFVVIDVLSEKEYNKDNVIIDLGNIKFFPKECFKADVKAVSDQIGHCIAAEYERIEVRKTGESKKERNKRIRGVKTIKGKFFDANLFGKVPTIQATTGRASFMKLVKCLNAPVSKASSETVCEQLELPEDLSRRFNRLAGKIQEICDMSERITELCEEANSVEDASLIAGKALTEFFGEA
jgi:hypothetical protein